MMNGQRLSFNRGRAALVAVLFVLGLIGLWWMIQSRPSNMGLGCLFHTLTGLHCPGCGMTRAAEAVMGGRLIEAAGYNLVGITVLPFAGLWLGLELLGWVMDRPLGEKLRPSKTTAVVLLIIVILFSIVRNFPWQPFSWLAPS